jgi:hypothetical protein
VGLPTIEQEFRSAIVRDEFGVVLQGKLARGAEPADPHLAPVSIGWKTISNGCV